MNTPNQKQPPTSPTESGFTLIECLLAIIIVGVLLVAIAPAIVLSMATRVQARRVELGTQAARTYIDGVRSGNIATPNFIVVLNEVNTVTNPDNTVTQKFNPQRDNLFSQAKAPPAVSLTCQDATPANAGTPSVQNDYCTNKDKPDPTYYSLYCINIDGRGCKSDNSRSPKNMIVQAFRSATTLDDTGSKGYVMGVRVYRLDAFNGSGTLLKTTPPNGNKRMATYTAGVGDRRSPLVEMTTEIGPTNQSDPSGKWKSLCGRLGGEACP